MATPALANRVRNILDERVPLVAVLEPWVFNGCCLKGLYTVASEK